MTDKQIVEAVDQAMEPGRQQSETRTRGRRMRGRHILSLEERKWAYEQWCIGYTQEQIAEALDCSRTTIQKTTSDKPRIRPTLVYPEQIKEQKNKVLPSMQELLARAEAKGRAKERQAIMKWFVDHNMSMASRGLHAYLKQIKEKRNEE